MTTREQEDALVLEYQKTEDQKILERLYADRVTTFEILAQRYWHPALSTKYPTVEDLKNDYYFPFLNAIKKFKPNKKSFNTYLYTSILNYNKNIYMLSAAKKKICKDAIT